jgi:hypothetical protein
VRIQMNPRLESGERQRSKQSVYNLFTTRRGVSPSLKA